MERLMEGFIFARKMHGAVHLLEDIISVGNELLAVRRKHDAFAKPVEQTGVQLFFQHLKIFLQHPLHIFCRLPASGESLVDSPDCFFF